MSTAGREWSGSAGFGLDTEGFEVHAHASAVRDFRDPEVIGGRYADEIRRLLLDVTGADHVSINAHGVLRFSERSPESGALDNSRPARFVHIDCSDAAAADFYRARAPATDRTVVRSAQYNVWRVLSPPPQDVPLAVCDARTLAPADLVPADAVFDREDGEIAFMFERSRTVHSTIRAAPPKRSRARA